MTRLTAGLAAVVVLVAVGQVMGQLYSVNSVTDELVLIDPVSGDVSLVGPLQYDVSDIDLASYGGRLFGLDRNTSDRVDLLEIHPLAGGVIWSQQVFLDGTPIEFAEGLAASNGGLVIGFHQTGPSWLSSVMGDLGLDGAVSNPVDYGSSVDFDGLTKHGGLFYFSDSELPTSGSETTFFSLDMTGPTFHEITRYPIAQHRSNDVAVVGSHLYSLDHTAGALWTTDLVTGEFVSGATLSETGSYGGLAVVSNPIPEPSTLIIWSLLGAIGIGVSWRSRRRRAA